MTKPQRYDPYTGEPINSAADLPPNQAKKGGLSDASKLMLRLTYGKDGLKDRPMPDRLSETSRALLGLPPRRKPRDE